MKPVAINKFETFPKYATPEAAAAFVGEPFYPHLATLLVHKEVSKGLTKRLDNYREMRDQAAANISRQINTTAELSTADAQASWTEFNSQESAN